MRRKRSLIAALVAVVLTVLAGAALTAALRYQDAPPDKPGPPAQKAAPQPDGGHGHDHGHDHEHQ